MPTALPGRLIKDAASLVKRGFTLREVARVVGCHPTVLSRRLRAKGIDTEAGRRRGPESLRLPEKLIRRAAKLVQNGSSIREAASQVGVHEMTLGKKLKPLGIVSSHPWVVTEQMIRQAVATMERGASFTYAAQQIGCHPNTLTAKLRLFGIENPLREAELRHRKEIHAILSADIGKKKERSQTLSTDVLQEYRSGATVLSIANRLGITKQAVYYRLKQAVKAEHESDTVKRLSRRPKP